MNSLMAVTRYSYYELWGYDNFCSVDLRIYLKERIFKKDTSSVLIEFNLFKKIEQWLGC